MRSEAHIAMQSLKDEKHKMQISAHHARKEKELDAINIKNVKSDVKTSRAYRIALENKVADLNSKFINLKSTHQLQIDNLQEEIDFQRKKTRSKDAEVQKLKSKEKEYEEKLKEKEIAIDWLENRFKKFIR